MITMNQPTLARSRGHIAYLDGLRGISALWVVLFHFIGLGVPKLTSPTARFALGWLTDGRFPVAIFIVLSGYLLQRQLVEGELNGGFSGFVRRRFMRIVPTYWIALALAMVLQVVSSHGAHHLQLMSGPNVLTHALLLHNWFPAYAGQFNGSFWSVPVEWDIYFIFALALLPVWRSWGIAAAVILAFSLSLAPFCLLPPAHNLSWSAPWFIGLFALGMAGCIYNNGESASVRDRRNPSTVNTVIAVGSLILLAELGTLISRGLLFWLPSCLEGAVTLALIIYCGQAVKAGTRPLPLRILSSRFAVALATFSYSLYLTHETFVLKLHPIIEHFHPSPELRCLFGLPETLVALVGAYGFYWFAERPFSKPRAVSR